MVLKYRKRIIIVITSIFIAAFLCILILYYNKIHIPRAYWSLGSIHIAVGTSYTYDRDIARRQKITPIAGMEYFIMIGQKQPNSNEFLYGRRPAYYAIPRCTGIESCDLELTGP